MDIAAILGISEWADEHWFSSGGGIVPQVAFHVTLPGKELGIAGGRAG
jgi:hypothetical protein